MINLYGLKRCTTCQKAIKYLNQHNVTVEEIDIREQPPAAELIAAALANTGGKPRQIMNTSGELYRDLGLKDKLNDMSEAELVTLLSENGMLLKRPFITDGHQTTSGAKPEVLATWING